MSIILGKLSEEIFNILKGHDRSLTLYGDNGNIVYDPSSAVRMFIMPDKMMLSITEDDDNDIEVKLYIGKSVEIKNIESIIKTIRAVCSRLNCLFNIRRYGKDITPKDFAYQVNTNESITEAYYNSLKTTYENVGNCKLILKHDKSVDESKRGSSSRNIKTIYVQNENKEKILLPTTNINAARAIARHLSNGGKIYDSVGDYIVEASKEFHILKSMIKNIHKIKKDIIKPSGRSRKTIDVKPIKNIKPDPYVSSISESIRKRLNEIRNTFKIISGSRNYKKYHDFISTKNKYESSIISDSDNEKLFEFFSENGLDTNSIEIVANVMGTKTSTLPMFVVDDDTLLEISVVYKRKFKYGIDYITSENTIIFFNPDCFSEILSFLETNNKPFEIISNESVSIPCNVTIVSDSISDIVEILHNELGYTSEYTVEGNEIHFKEQEVYENVVPLLNISNIKFTTEKLNSTHEDKNMAEPSNKVMDFANKWISDNGASCDATRLANELSGFMNGDIVPNIKKDDVREFKNPRGEFSYKTRIVSDSISDEELSNFLNVISDKLRDGAELTKPEKQIAEKAVTIYDNAQQEKEEVEEPVKSKSEFAELEEWFKQFNPDITEDETDETVPSSNDVSDDSESITIRLVDDNATLSTLNKIAELTDSTVSDLVSNREVTFNGTKEECDSVIDQLTSIMNQNGDLGSVDISGPETESDREANDIIDDVMTSESLTENDIPELKRLLSIVESDSDLTSKYIESDGNFNVVNEQTGICFHTVKGNRKIADYYVESFNNENVKQQRKLLKSIIESLIEEASRSDDYNLDVMIDEQYISELKDCLSEAEKSNDVSFRVITHEGSYAVVNEQTGIIVNQYSDNKVAEKTAENYNENKESSRKHLKSIIEMALSEAEKDIKKDKKEDNKIEDDENDKELNEAIEYAKNVDLEKVVRNNVSAHGSKKFTNLDKFNFVNNIAEHLFKETVKNEKFKNLGLNEDYFVSLAENFFDNSVVPVLKEKHIYEDTSISESKKEDDGIDFSKPVSVSKTDSVDQLKKINKKFKEFEKKADKLDSGKADFDVIEYDDSFHVVEKGFPAVCLGEFSTENKARSKAADFISDPEYGVETLKKNIEKIIDESDVDDEKLDECVDDSEIGDESNDLEESTGDDFSFDDFISSGALGEPKHVTADDIARYTSIIAHQLYDLSKDEDPTVTVTPDNFMGQASTILHDNIDKMKDLGFEFDKNVSEDDATIPTNDQATFKDEISSDIVRNPEQDEMDYLRKMAGLDK